EAPCLQSRPLASACRGAEWALIHEARSGGGVAWGTSSVRRRSPVARRPPATHRPPKLPDS
ncbi:MAG: hypothetical protein ACLQPH_03030, partial [Acidimicrobiales bacterium]